MNCSAPVESAMIVPMISQFVEARFVLAFAGLYERRPQQM